MTRSSGWDGRGKFEGFWVLLWNHQENGDAIKRNGEVKERNSHGQDAEVGCGHAMWGYGGTAGWSSSSGSWIQVGTLGQRRSKEMDLQVAHIEMMI